MVLQRWITLLLFALTLGCTQAADEPPQQFQFPEGVPKEQLLPVTDRNPSFERAARFWHLNHPSGPVGHFAQAARLQSGQTSRPLHFEAGSSRGPLGEVAQAPASLQFRHGGRWGPLPVGENKFYMNGYPLSIPDFQHLYTNDDLAPADFETFFDAKQVKIHTTGTVFRPEPNLLAGIREHILRNLEAGGIAIHQVPYSQPINAAFSKLYEGDWLWPPVKEVDEQGGALGIPTNTLSLRLREAVMNQIRRHHADKRLSLFHLRLIDVNGHLRDILMARIQSAAFVDKERHPSGSHLWGMFEGMKDGQGARKLAFLGATYLPEYSEDKLLASRVIFPAFAEYFRSFHA